MKNIPTKIERFIQGAMADIEQLGWGCGCCSDSYTEIRKGLYARLCTLVHQVENMKDHNAT